MSEALLRQVRWNIPMPLYKELQAEHQATRDALAKSAPASEQDFACGMLKLGLQAWRQVSAQP